MARPAGAAAGADTAVLCAASAAAPRAGRDWAESAIEYAAADGGPELTPTSVVSP